MASRNRILGKVRVQSNISATWETVIAMTFWQIVSLFRDELPVLANVFQAEKETNYLVWLGDFKEIVRSQKRHILDAQLPESLVRRALQTSKLKFVINNGVLQTAGAMINSQELTALQVYQTYGANAIEEVLEYGSFPT